MPIMPNTQQQANAALNLANFSQLTAQNLKASVLQDLAAGNALLDTLAKSTPTAASTALADITQLELVDNALERSWGLLSHLNSVMSSDDIREAHHAVLPELSAYGTRQGQHEQLFARYQQVQENAEFFSALSVARQRSISLAIRSFKLSGVALPADKKARFADINSELSSLSAKFSDNVLDATQAYKRILTEAELAGITETGLNMLAAAGEAYQKDQPDEDVSAHKVNGTLYVATLDIPVYLAIMTHAQNRKLREEIYQAYCTRASAHAASDAKEFDNAANMVNILKLRQEKAALLEFKHYADVSLATKMAESPQKVFDFLNDLAKRAKAPAQKDLAQLTQEAAEHGIAEIQPWDTAFLSEKVKNKHYNLSQEALRPYFQLPKVLAGLFDIVQKLYGIRISQKKADLWHEDVQFYEVYEHDKLIGGFYFDLYARTGKRGGAWMNGFQSKLQLTHADDTLNQLPVAFMVCNFTPPTKTDTGNKPALLTHDEVITLFHEFGHGLHHLLTKVTVSGVAGVNGVEWDAVELPSQFMEFWAWEAAGIALISQHIDTGEALPQSMLDAMLAARHFQSGMMALRQLEFALFDLTLHTHTQITGEQDIQNILDKVRAEVALIIPPAYNRFQNGFSHIFAGGYAAGYYSYKWAELLASDAFDRFEAEGIFNTSTGADFKAHILEMGGSKPAAENFAAFRKREPQLAALLRHSGWESAA